MPPGIDPVILSQLQPHAYALGQVFQDRNRRNGFTVSEQRRLQRQRERELTNSLWAKAHQLGLTTFPVPPILVSLFCRALWAVVWYLAQEILNGDEDGSVDG